MKGPGLHAVHVYAGYRGRAVVKDFSADMRPGEVVCIVGPNGAGKTTILRVLTALLKPMEGVVYIDGFRLHDLSARERGRRIGAVLTERVDPGALRVIDVVLLGRYPHRGPIARYREEDYEIAERALKLVGANHLRDRLFHELSDGEKQKVLIARALAQEPRVLVLDEPLTFLDAKHRVEIALLLRRLASQGVTVVVSLHEIELACRVCDRVIVLKDGEVFAQGAPEEVLNAFTISQVYGVPVERVVEPFASIEMQAPRSGRPEVFVVSSFGYGTPVYRLLARAGIAFATGILYPNDVDALVANAMGVEAVTCRDMLSPDSDIVERAMALIDAARFVIDSGFPVVPGLEHNLDLLRYAASAGKTVVCLRDKPIVECRTVSRISALIDVLKYENPSPSIVDAR